MWLVRSVLQIEGNCATAGSKSASVPMGYVGYGCFSAVIPLAAFANSTGL